MDSTQSENVFQVHIQLPKVFTSKFTSLIPKQRAKVNQLLEKQIILNYALDISRENLWITIRAKNQLEVMDILATFPIIKDVQVDIFELAFFDTAPINFPHIILN
ncbi:MAG: hypothetical protein ACK50L_00045 [Bacteroidota bacterium]|jgi:hypothetical protein